MIFKRFSALILLWMLLGGANRAGAHGYLIRAMPPDRATLESPPTRLQYWFSEELEPDFSSVNLRDQSGTIIATGGVDENDRTLLRLQIAPGLPEGAYIVELRPAFAGDGHVVAESQVFFVGDAVSGVEGSAAKSEALPLEVMWRGMITTALAALFGTLALYHLVLLPAWKNPAHPAGLLPPRVMKRLNRIVIAALILAYAANLLALLQQSMVFFNVDAGQVLSQGLWQVVRIGSRFGDVWNWRMILLALVTAAHFASMYYRPSLPQVVRPLWLVNVWLAALILGTMTLNGHAAGSLVWPWMALGVHWLHTLAASFWIGGIAALMIVLPAALAPYSGEARQQAFVAATRRLSNLLVIALALVISTGIYNALNWFYAPADLQTSYGSTLGVKIFMVTLLIFVGALHHLALRPNLAARFSAMKASIRWAGNFGGSLRAEGVIGVAVLLCAGLLSATPIPQPDFLRSAPPVPSSRQTLDGIDLTMTLSPGGPGLNSYDLLIADVPDSAVRVQMMLPARDWRSDWLDLEADGQGLYVAAGDEIDRAGEWWTVVELKSPENEPLRAVFRWTIDDSGAIRAQQEPSAANLAALAAVLLVIGFIGYPGAAGLVKRLDLRPAILVVAGGSALITVGMMIAGAAIVAENQRRYDERLWPAPLVINTVPPDTESLNRGSAVYEAQCAAWADIADDFGAFRQSLPVMRDDAIYAAITEGWRDLPPCAENLPETSRWDLVNFLRTASR